MRTNEKTNPVVINFSEIYKIYKMVLITVPSQSSWKQFLLPTEMVLKTEN